ncbi:glycosyl hydrolase family 71-domain-containing protein [Cercophora scortea]|uniref:Glycosyl hydrolase family 71-domain-containing protein n=1 Tax=Cercophora scortea TaxID=314031 RepID=A0AAE0J513_9PEZI|nr:glycosyl hydrolase family 71-domain-containing protein [Cercophora scortea]
MAPSDRRKPSTPGRDFPASPFELLFKSESPAKQSRAASWRVEIDRLTRTARLRNWDPPIGHLDRRATDVEFHPERALAVFVRASPCGILRWPGYGESHYLTSLSSTHYDDGNSKWVNDMPHDGWLDMAKPFLAAYKAGADKVDDFIEDDQTIYWYRPTLKKCAELLP